MHLWRLLVPGPGLLPGGKTSIQLYRYFRQLGPEPTDRVWVYAVPKPYLPTIFFPSVFVRSRSQAEKPFALRPLSSINGALSLNLYSKP
jgi:hypothetical protein